MQDCAIATLNDVHLVLDDNFEVLRALNLHISAGSVTSLLGPSGCGKTLILYLLAGFLRPSSGTVVVDGKLVTRPSNDRSLVFQNYALFPWKNVVSNVEAALFTSPISDQARHERSHEALRLVGLLDYAAWPIHKLSGGMQQRVAIARALVAQPKLLLLDEPFAALDHVNRERLRDLLTELKDRHGITLLLVSHNITDAILFSDQLIVFTKRPARIKHVFDTARIRPENVVQLAELKEQIRDDLRAEFADDEAHIRFASLLQEK